MNERINDIRLRAGISRLKDEPKFMVAVSEENKVIDPSVGLEKFAELIVRECIDKIETYRIPVGNSVSGELACEWTYNALKEIRDDIKEHFGVEE
jgi:hypothetical protein